MNFNNEYGLAAENYFASRLNELGIKHEQEDSWYDFIVEGKKVEVKSCDVSIRQIKKIKRKKKITYRSGRFHFTKEKNRKLQYKNNIWVCFILRHENSFIILGCIKAKHLKMKDEICIHKLKELEMISFNSWINKIIKKKKDK